MSALEKLAIRGIRSFDNNRVEVVQFFNPVTVIVGHNGSGKTTIIECLKYATTGDQPPNTRGGAFVHDPKMANEKEVKAQVKLRFKAANGQTLMVTRNLSVSVKKGGGMTSKTLEGVLSFASNDGPNGKRNTISTKCANMAEEIPSLLGVSKSVLENVIFCHQEDSYWPLSEPSQLKKKFDDIFEATRYSKALDAIKSLRKDRVAELKADKERLESVHREKLHADKLKSRASDLRATIVAKEHELENLRVEVETMAKQNKEFYEKATKFRETYLKAQAAQDRQKHLEDDYKSTVTSGTVKILDDTESTLSDRIQGFEATLTAQKNQRHRDYGMMREEQEKLAETRQLLKSEQGLHGQLIAKQDAHRTNLASRDALICELASQQSIRGFEVTPFEQRQVDQFISVLAELQQRQQESVEHLQAESSKRISEYQRRIQTLNAQLAGLNAQRDSRKEAMANLRKSITADEAALDEAGTLATDLRRVSADAHEKKAKVALMKAELEGHGFDKQLEEKTRAIRRLEDERERISTELTSISLQADTRAKLDLKREESRRKDREITDCLEAMGPKYRQLVGHEPATETAEREIDRAVIDKDRDVRHLESESTASSRKLQQLETTLGNLNSQMKSKQEELRASETGLKPHLADHSTVEAALIDAEEQLKLCREEAQVLEGSSKFFEAVLKNGHSKKICTSCNRPLAENEMRAFEKHVGEMLRKATSDKLKEMEEDVQNWEGEVSRLQQLLPLQITISRLRQTDIPALEKQSKEVQIGQPGAVAEAEAVLARLDAARQVQKSLQTLKQQVFGIVRLTRENNTLEIEIQSLESSLRATGSTKTADDLQAELSQIQTQGRTLEREKNALMTDRDRQSINIRSEEDRYHALQIREGELRNNMNALENTKLRINLGTKEIEEHQIAIKDLEVKISDAAGPIRKAEEEQRSYQFEMENTLSSERQKLHNLNLSAERLDLSTKTITQYIRDRIDQKLRHCINKLSELELEIQQVEGEVERFRALVQKQDNDVSAAGADLANLRENLRLRKLQREIQETKDVIKSLKLEEASKAKEQFEEKWGKAKAAENEAQARFSRLGGELSSHQSQFETLEKDLKEYVDINKRYTDQLVKVKMADMANSDLEKYAKALDSAIMKYHSLKMEEVNETMRHLWNKTYQGTDIDGIKIVSEGDVGTGSRKQYNYRVVMIKDQVEMDMRGRCSAGQKMLASIIIRLALSDSFGQNCGILALDEPTNALDTENIDALAMSLVDIIKERRSHSNFQLIIITHDENFLKKLGEEDVIEYYWRVSRDARQKSTVEKQSIAS